MSAREPAWRLFAEELNLSTVEEKTPEEKAVGYLRSPLGARMNRVISFGTLSPAESIGRDPAQPFVRARLTDPTGDVSVTAGGFQPRALAALQNISEPTRAMVVGKPHVFHQRDGGASVSIRAEAVRVLTGEEMRLGWLEAAAHTLDRLELRELAERDPARADEWIRRLGWPASRGNSAREARSMYPKVDPAMFRRSVERVLGSLESPSVSSLNEGAARPPPLRVTRAPPPTAPPPLSASERAEEGTFLDLVDELSEESIDGYADLKTTFSRAAARGIVAHRCEEILNRLEEAGTLEEPIVGKLRRA